MGSKTGVRLGASRFSVWRGRGAADCVTDRTAAREQRRIEGFRPISPKQTKRSEPVPDRQDHFFRRRDLATSPSTRRPLPSSVERLPRPAQDFLGRVVTFSAASLRTRRGRLSADQTNQRTNTTIQTRRRCMDLLAPDTTLAETPPRASIPGQGRPRYDQREGSPPSAPTLSEP